MYFQSPFGNRQPQSQGAELTGDVRIGLPEGTEDPYDGLRVHADARVVDFHRHLARSCVAHTDADGTTFRCELARVLEQVPKHLLQPSKVAVQPVANCP